MGGTRRRVGITVAGVVALALVVGGWGARAHPPPPRPHYVPLALGNSSER
jgi:hypothetical protein